MSTPIISTENVVKRFAGHTALDDISISVPEGSIYGLLGPNGAGKTTLIRIINQITGPDSGVVLFKGERLNPGHGEQIGYLPEERGLYKKMKVGEQLLYLARLKGLSRKEAMNRLQYWFEKFEITGWWHKKVEELSKGMAQKVQFIVTVLHEPKLLILDEPFSGFDPINASLIRNEIMELQRKGATVIFSTHNMGSVEELCDQIALINRSKKILEGSVREIKNKYRMNVYEVEFTGNWIGFANALWSGAELMEKSEDAELKKAKIRLRNDHTPNDLLNAILPFAKIHALHEVIPNMNDIFIKCVTDGNAGSHSAFTE
ncbi:MAG: ATP-binding cassette domain-containing protein [Bacteroidia bacterium]|nr:ATP-binding cassette domain-containing protein [Bacteroidia bacterium]